MRQLRVRFCMILQTLVEMLFSRGAPCMSHCMFSRIIVIMIIMNTFSLGTPLPTICSIFQLVPFFCQYTLIESKNTVCRRSSDPYRIVMYYIKWAITSWACSNMDKLSIVAKQLTYTRMGQKKSQKLIQANRQTSQTDKLTERRTDSEKDISWNYAI